MKIRYKRRRVGIISSEIIYFQVLSKFFARICVILLKSKFTSPVSL